jgi:hypothetical protein
VTPKEAGSAFLKGYLAYGSLLFELGETYRDQAPCAWTVGVPGDVCTESQTLGHSQIALTLNTYSHVIPALGRAAADEMDAVLGPRSDAHVSS